jgi:hypothetical protein
MGLSPTEPQTNEALQRSVRIHIRHLRRGEEVDLHWRKLRRIIDKKLEVIARPFPSAGSFRYATPSSIMVTLWNGGTPCNAEHDAQGGLPPLEGELP